MTSQAQITRTTHNDTHNLINNDVSTRTTSPATNRTKLYIGQSLEHLNSTNPSIDREPSDISHSYPKAHAYIGLSSFLIKTRISNNLKSFYSETPKMKTTLSECLSLKKQKKKT